MKIKNYILAGMGFLPVVITYGCGSTKNNNLSGTPTPTPGKGEEGESTLKLIDKLTGLFRENNKTKPSTFITEENLNNSGLSEDFLKMVESSNNKYNSVYLYCINNVLQLDNDKKEKLVTFLNLITPEIAYKSVNLIDDNTYGKIDLDFIFLIRSLFYKIKEENNNVTEDSIKETMKNFHDFARKDPVYFKIIYWHSMDNIFYLPGKAPQPYCLPYFMKNFFEYVGLLESPEK